MLLSGDYKSAPMPPKPMPNPMPSSDAAAVAALLAFAGLLAACAEPAERSHRVYAFGTEIAITIRHPDAELARLAFARLAEDFQTLHAAWHPWEAGPLKRVNQLLRAGGWFSAPASVLPLLQESARLSALSGGYFNPAMGLLVEQWGFHRHNPTDPHTPDMALIKEITATMPRMSDIEFDGIRLRGRNRYAQFDPGGVGKGYALDLAMQTLATLGIDNALINAGGDIALSGRGATAAWQIGILNPRARGVIATVAAAPAAGQRLNIFTSGDYQRYYLDQGKRRHHILDPLTGEPAAHTIAATVMHGNGALADAAATALMAAGKQHWREVTTAMGVEHAMLLTTEGELLVSRAMREAIALNDTAGLRVIVH